METEKNGRKRKQTERFGNDTVPATPFAKSRIQRNKVGLSGAVRDTPNAQRKGEGVSHPIGHVETPNKKFHCAQ